MIVIDEAYTAFTDADYLDWAIRYPNVVVMRTLSKVGLAGSRFGMLIGHPDWIVEFDKIRLPYNINVLTQTVVQFALERAPTLEEQSGKIRQERRRLTTLLEERGFSVWPSEANFVVVDCESILRGVFSRSKAVSDSCEVFRRITSTAGKRCA